MTEFTRLTIVGSERRADVVVPSEDALAAVLPRLMELLGERTASAARPLTLVRVTGEQLDLSLSSEQQALDDGELLWLMRLSDAPPPPEVSDVTDVVSESLTDTTGLWSDRSRAIVGAVGVGALSLAAGGLVLSAPGIQPFAVVGIAWLVLALAAVVLGRMGYRWPAVAFTAAAFGLSYPVGDALLATLGRSIVDPGFAALGLGLIVAWLSLGIGTGIGLAIRPALWAAAVGIVLPALTVVLLAIGVDPLGSFAVTAVVTSVCLGLVPWYAMSTSGLTGLDDQVSTGVSRNRRVVLTSLHSAYRALSWTTFAIAVPLAVTAGLLVASPNGWAVGLGWAIALIAALRTRAFPRAAESMALWAAAGVVTVAGILPLFAIEPWLAIAALAVLALVTAIVVGTPAAAHQRASLRRLGNLIEALAVLALLPLLLGVFDVYALLLGTF
ncbi:EsaB/YukD family protein [Compostimonas suwonensis]|uniref:Type VII secretion integral membrane protein EccD n=1 Tax=Compostimonas suwonensis TaxID=1048394 RepID=A0A2M9C590_9MICO|nr:EsaB/YukD family protein [Compostimonas suwonensis]PJJ65701.1 type VII secretion integral membrane protein EccD [Compostimonas suwonensis]